MRLRRYERCPSELVPGVQCELDRLHWVNGELSLLHIGDDVRDGYRFWWPALPVELVSHATSGEDRRFAADAYRNSTFRVLLDPEDILRLLSIGYRKGCAAGIALGANIIFDEGERDAWAAGRSSR